MGQGLACKRIVGCVKQFSCSLDAVKTVTSRVSNQAVVLSSADIDIFAVDAAHASLLREITGLRQSESDACAKPISKLLRDV